MRNPLGTFETLEEQANKLLRSAGYASLCRDFEHYAGRPINSGIFEATQMPGSYVYEPSSSKSKPAKHISDNPCVICGGQRSKFSGRGECRNCYRARALERHVKRVTQKFSRIDQFNQRRFHLEDAMDLSVAWDARRGATVIEGSDPVFVAVTKDFAPDLIDAITEIEVEYDLRAAFWPRNCGMAFVYLENAGI